MKRTYFDDFPATLPLLDGPEWDAAVAKALALIATQPDAEVLADALGVTP